MTQHYLSADEYIKRIDRILAVTGAIALALSVGLAFLIS